MVLTKIRSMIGVVKRFYVPLHVGYVRIVIFVSPKVDEL